MLANQAWAFYFTRVPTPVPVTAIEVVEEEFVEVKSLQGIRNNKQVFKCKR